MKLISKKLRLIVLLSALSILSVLVVKQYLPQNSGPSALAKRAQQYGSYVNTNGEVPGHPEKAEENLKLLCKIYSTYLQNHREEYLARANKHFEPLILAVTKDLSTHRDEYREFQGISFAEQMSNPDTEYSDGYAGRKVLNAFVYAENPFRPDGKPVGGPKPPGTRDVLAQTSIYFHLNGISSKDGHIPTTVNPVGFYLVLWDDCSVERIPYYDTRMAPSSIEKGSFHVCFRGQAGTPPGTMTFDAYNAKFMRAKKPLRGQPGIVGMTLSGEVVKE